MLTWVHERRKLSAFGALRFPTTSSQGGRKKKLVVNEAVGWGEAVRE